MQVDLTQYDLADLEALLPAELVEQEEAAAEADEEYRRFLADLWAMEPNGHMLHADGGDRLDGEAGMQDAWYEHARQVSACTSEEAA